MTVPCLGLIFTVWPLDSGFSQVLPAPTFDVRHWHTSSWFMAPRLGWQLSRQLGDSLQVGVLSILTQFSLSSPEQEERSREAIEQWRQWHYDGLYPPYLYNRHHIWPHHHKPRRQSLKCIYSPQVFRPRCLSNSLPHKQVPSKGLNLGCAVVNT